MSIAETDSNSAKSTCELDFSVTDPRSVPLQQIDVVQSKLFQIDTLWTYFDRLRNEALVHRTTSPLFGRFGFCTASHTVMSRYPLGS